MQIRTFTESDYPAFVALLNAAHPESPRAEADLRHMDSHRAPEDRHGRFLAESDGQVVGSAAFDTPWNYNAPGRFGVSVRVRPGYEHLRPVLWSFLMEQIAPLKPTSLLTSSREDWAELPFYLGEGFLELDRLWDSILDLTTFDPEPLMGQAALALQSGITIRTLAEQPWKDEAYLRTHYALLSALLRDVPSADPIVPWPFELWMDRFLNRPGFRPEGYFIALDGEKEVGLSQTFDSGLPQTLAQGMTGVLGSHRRRGIAIALKLKGAEHAREAGYRYIRTGNHSVNRPMLAINEAMGFVKQPSVINLLKEL